MFPVYTGINRCYCGYFLESTRVPCIHRDKPTFGSMQYLNFSVFPVYTGINHIRHFAGLSANCVRINQLLPDFLFNWNPLLDKLLLICSKSECSVLSETLNNWAKYYTVLYPFCFISSLSKKACLSVSIGYLLVQ